MITEIGPNLRGPTCSTPPVTPSRRASSTSTPTTTPRCSGTRRCSRRRYHGVTTVVAGNCGSRSRPTRPEHRDVIVRTLENVEDMDPATLSAGISVGLRDLPRVPGSRRPARDRAQLHRLHRPHRRCGSTCMGDAAYERAATAEEIERMCRLVREAIDVGAAGSLDHLLVRAPRRRRQAGPEPLRRARRGRRPVHGRRPGRARASCSRRPAPVQLRRRVRVAAARRPAVHLPAVRAARRTAPGRPSAARRGLSHGADVWPQVTPRPLTMQFTLADPYSLNVGQVFGELMKGDREARRSPPTATRRGGRGRPTSSSPGCARGGRPSRSPSR